MVAQNIGAGRWDRVGTITNVALGYTVAMTLSVIVAIILFDRPVMALFVGSDSPAIPIARHIQLLSSWTFVMFGMTMVLFSTVRANGATIAPLIILAVALFPIRFGFAVVARSWLGTDALVDRLPDRLARRAGDGLCLLSSRRLATGRDAGPAHQEAEEKAHGDGEPAGRLHPTS